MRLTRIAGPNPLVNEAIKQIELSIWFEFNDAAHRSLDALESIQNAAQRQASSCKEDTLLRAWGELSKSTESLLIKALAGLIQIGSSNPICVSSDPADWAYDILRPHLGDILDWAGKSFLPKYLALLGDDEENEASLATDFFLEIDNPLAAYISDAKIHLAGKGWTPAGPEVMHDASQIATLRSSPATQSEPTGTDLRFTLADLENPGPNAPRTEVVFYLHPLLKEAISEARKCVDVASQQGQKLTDPELAGRSPVLRAASHEELNYVFQRSKTPHKCSIEIMVGRANLPIGTIERYVRLMKSPSSERTSGE